MTLQPQDPSQNGRINARLFPPCCFIATAVDFSMMAATQGDRELIADLAAERRCLGKAQMMGIGGTPAADEARLLGDRFHMLPVANSTGHRQRQDRSVGTCCPISASAASSQRFGLLYDYRLVRHESREL